MKKALLHHALCTVLSALTCFIGERAFAQQTIDPANYITSDNAPNQTSGTTADTPEYKEVGPWYTGTTGIAWGTDYRQTSQLGGESIAGRSAKWITNIPAGKSGNYVLYVYVCQSPNNASNVFYTVQREFETVVLDSLRHDQRRSTVNPNTATGNGAWVPLTILPLTVGNVFTTVGADSTSGTTIMRADAIRWLRSSELGPDLEFGRRDKNGFNTTRVGENWLDSPLGSITYKEMPLFNLGASDLIVSNVTAVVKPGRWDFKPKVGSFPLTIHPGEKSILMVGFRPFQEESVKDSMVVESNDTLESRAIIPLSGNGINYNFILNASLSNEPHYNAPFNNLGNPKRPIISLSGPPWSESGTGYAAFPYPIASGNIKGIFNADAAPTTGVEHDFQLPDSVNGKPGSSGYYFIEWGVIAFTSNSETNARIVIVPPFSIDTIKTTFSQNDNVGTPPFWKSLAPTAVFLTQGDFTKVFYYRPFSPSGSAVLRADLLRIRKIPTGPAIVASDNVNFQNVSIFSDIRAKEDNYRLDIVINSGGESLLRIDSMKFRTGRYFSFVNPPPTPLELPAINGSLRLTIKFLPDTIASLTDRISIYTNDTTKNPYNVALLGAGVGTNLTVEENDVTSFIYPPGPMVYPDFANMNKWQTIADAGASGGSRMVGYVYWLATDPQRNKVSYVEYFPKIPKRTGMPVEIDSFNVYAQIPTGSGNSTPRARYIIFPQGGGTPIIDTITQNSRTSSLAFLGRAAFLRSDDRDAHTATGGGGINGYIRLENDTTLVSDYYRDSLVNRARRDSFVIRADAIILRQKAADVEYIVYPTLPGDYELSQNYPNPFNPATEILFRLKSRGMVDLRVYDILGREVRAMVSEWKDPGSYKTSWDGRNNVGISVASGVYFYRLAVNDFVATKKMLLLR